MTVAVVDSQFREHGVVDVRASRIRSAIDLRLLVRLERAPRLTHDLRTILFRERDQNRRELLTAHVAPR